MIKNIAKIEWQKYKRFFTFGCSFTSYLWPTWADILSKQMPQASFFNFGLSGSGNPLISYRIAEANNRFKFTDTDLVMVMFTSYTREDRWVSDKRWLAGGNIFYHRHYSEQWVKQYADERGYLIRDAAVIDMSVKYIDSLSCDSFCMLSVPFVYGAESMDLSGAPQDIYSIYKDTFNKFKPSMYELELRGNWNELNLDYPFVDGHPSPYRHCNYLEKVGFSLSDSTKQYAWHSSQIVKTMPNRDVAPKYFPEQDNQLAQSYKLLF